MSAPNNAVHLMASYFEFTVGANVIRNGVAQPSRRYTLTLGMDTNRVPTVYALTDTNYGTNPIGTPYKYTVAGGADKYNTYEMVYDPVTATVDVWVNGIERISDYPGNRVYSLNFSRAASSVAVFF